jgi:Domain of unknown function (DUF5666)/CarboxypepD_reg-like domain
MSSYRRTFLLLLCGIALGFGTACSSNTGAASFSPTAPSPVGGGGATITGQVMGVSPTPVTALSLSDSGLSPTAGTLATTDAKGITVTVAGTGISTTADATGQFTLTNVPSGDVQLTFSGAGVSATITITGVGPTDRVQISVRLQGASAKVDSEQHSAPGSSKREYQGRITAITPATRTIQIPGLTVNIPTTASIRHGSKTLLFADLVVGDHVQARGTKEGTTLTATEVKVERGDDDDDDDKDDKNKGSDNRRDVATELTGAVSGLTGTCPTVTLTVQGTPVKTNASTSYSDVTCATLAGKDVEVKGTKASDGSVLATKITLKLTEVSGPISGLSTGCPATFTVRNTKVTTTATTIFERVTCATLKNDLRVEVKGTKNPDGSLVATKVELDN